MLRRLTLLAALTFLLTLPFISQANAGEGVVRVGYQKYSTLYLLKLRGDLDRRLGASGTRVSWAEFQYGVPMLEALNAGQLDYATTGETPPVLAQARRGSELVYVAQEPPSPQSEGILVHRDSPIRTLAELKGKRIAVAKGANAHYLLLRALERGGLGVRDVDWVFLTPGDASAAFSGHAIDAWAIWDFQRALTEHQTGARTLVDGQGLVQNFECYTTRASYLRDHGDVIDAIREELARTDAWVVAHPDEAAAHLSRELGIDREAILLAFNRRHFGVSKVTPELRENQTQIAETLRQNRIIPQAVDIARAFPLTD